jgi:hypothetical protein
MISHISPASGKRRLGRYLPVKQKRPGDFRRRAHRQRLTYPWKEQSGETGAVYAPLCLYVQKCICRRPQLRPHASLAPAPTDRWWPMSGQDKPAAPAKPPTIGSIARDIRTEAGWSRVKLSTEIGWSLATLTAVESGRRPWSALSVERRQALLRHPIMADLHRRALAAGIVPPIPPGPPGPGDTNGGSDGDGGVNS